MTAQPETHLPPPLLPASGLSQQTAREHVLGQGACVPGQGACARFREHKPRSWAQPWAVEHRPGPWSTSPGQGARQAGLTRELPCRPTFPSLPGVSDPPCEPPEPSPAGSCCCRKDTLSVGLRHPHGAPDNPDPTERGSARSVNVEKPHFVWRALGREQPPGIARWACTSLRGLHRDPLCLGSMDPGPCSAMGQLATWATWPCCPNTSGSFLGPSQQCRGKSSQKDV